jgi:hypothetical protein
VLLSLLCSICSFEFSIDYKPISGVNSVFMWATIAGITDQLQTESQSCSCA